MGEMDFQANDNTCKILCFLFGISLYSPLGFISMHSGLIALVFRLICSSAFKFLLLHLMSSWTVAARNVISQSTGTLARNVLHVVILQDKQRPMHFIADVPFAASSDSSTVQFLPAVVKEFIISVPGLSRSHAYFESFFFSTFYDLELRGSLCNEPS